MSDIFVSYKAEDRRRVKPLVEALEAAGYSVWWDEQIGGGAQWRQAIESELGTAKSVIVVWSKRSVGADGTFVQDEAARAQQRRVYVPVTIDKVSLPLGFGETQALPLTAWRGDHSDPRFQAVLSSVRRLAGESGAPSPPDRSSAIDRRTALIGGGAAVAAAAGVGGWALLRSSPASGSIAVLPFANLSKDPAQRYFSDGIAEELRSALARLAGLEVVGRTSSEAVRNDDAQAAARKLGVGNILTGSVRQSPSTIRVSAQLIDGRDGIERWSQSYDRPPGDEIEIQTDIAESVAQALSITLGARARDAITVGDTNDAEAQSLMFKAVEASKRGDDAALLQAIGLGEAAIRRDPRYAEAYANTAMFVNWFASTFAKDVAELDRNRLKAARLAERALQLAPNLPSGHRAIADINRVQLWVRPAIKGYRKAIELAPGEGEVMGDFAILLASMGGRDEPLRLVDRAIALDPLNPQVYIARLMVLISMDRFDEAIAFGKSIERDKPYLFIFPELLAYALVIKGRYDEARAYAEKTPASDYNRLVVEGAILGRTGRAAEAGPVIAQLTERYGDAASFQFGQLYAQLGDKDRAFAALYRAFEIRDSGLLRTKTDPFIDPLRDEPRYTALLLKLDFPSV
ncbi:TIR domain-containing protein [Sphingomonas sabuli]|uniref:TIR domain-containing protein n=1 Tax=Sphingomonas sabuli TaxID=2764186 RepID=A0A7G9L4C9_9SPHN|nr:TIR domain-containing protein [Sphingomonas sabuli]QNM83478.1 TIR domain-containing protein [Sphingomonas sabuli]